MRIDDLIDALVIDTRPTRGAVALTMGVSILLALVGSSIVMAVGWGLRPDLERALATGPFWMKASYTATFGLAGGNPVGRLRPPGAGARAGVVVIRAPPPALSGAPAHPVLAPASGPRET